MITKVQTQANDFETLYLRAREKEGRLYTDAEVGLLPDVPIQHIHYNEWQIRKHSMNRFCRYLRMKKKPLAILEVGCGNGWFSHQLASTPAAAVTGIDTNHTELAQARRVFSQVPNLEFNYGTLSDFLHRAPEFDIIVFAASIQYFRPLSDALNTALGMLASGGEIHLIDSPFYHAADVAAAKQRSDHYYQQAGCPEMKDFYFHHCLDELNTFTNDVLYNPRSIINRFSWNKNPFYWIRIQH